MSTAEVKSPLPTNANSFIALYLPRFYHSYFSRTKFIHLSFTSHLHSITLAQLTFCQVMLCANELLCSHTCEMTIIFYYQEGRAPNSPLTRSYPV